MEDDSDITAVTCGIYFRGIRSRFNRGIMSIFLLYFILHMQNQFFSQVQSGVEGMAYVPQKQEVMVTRKPQVNIGASDLDPLFQKYFGSNWKTAKAIAYCESRLNPLAINQKSESIGLFQIRIAGGLASGRPSRAVLLTAEGNASFAAKMSNGGKNWSAWSCHKKVGV